VSTEGSDFRQLAER